MSRWSGRKVERLRALVIEHYPMVCILCHKPIRLGLHYLHPGSLTIEHRLPRSLGGTDDLANLGPAHRRCNLRRGNRPASSVLADRSAESGRSFFSLGPQGDPPPSSSPPRTPTKKLSFARNDAERSDYAVLPI